MSDSLRDPVNFRDHQLKAGNALQRSEKGAALPSLANIEQILREDSRWSGVLGFDTMAYQISKRRAPPYAGGEIGPWTDVDEVRTQIWLAREYGFQARVKDVRHAMMSAAAFAPYHPVRDYLENLRWDGVPRVLEAASTYFGAEDGGDRGEYNMLAVRKWLIAAVARALQPGCKADNVLILEGEQGKLKSTALENLGGQWFADTPFHIGSKDAFLVIQGVWIMELAELDGLSRAESSQAKAFFSSPRDRYVPKYIAHAVQVPRSCVFAGTVNLGTYLHDRTGNRRYWPLRVGRMDVDGILRDRDQLWAEAVVLYRNKTKHWVEPDEVEKFAVEQEAREIPDALEDRLRDYLTARTETTIGEVLESGLGLEIRDWTHAMHSRVGQLLNRLGWETAARPRGASGDARRPRLYRPKVEDRAVEPIQPRSTPGPPIAGGGPGNPNGDSALP